MADDTEEIDRKGAGEVTPAPDANEAPFSIRTPTTDHGRALGFSRRGQRVPSGTTRPAPSIAPEQETDAPAAAPIAAPEPGMPAEPTSADRSARHAAARAALEQQARAAWKDAYTNSQPVNPNGPIITPKQYRAAETAADAQATETAAQNNYARKTKNATTEAQMRASGQRYYVDGAGQVQPMLEARTNRPLFHGTPWEEGVHPQTGEPTLTKTDIYGQKQYKRPQMVAPSDTSDNQLYYKMPDGTLTAAGDIDKLMKHADPQVARTAMRAVHSRNSAMWKEAIAPMEEAAGQATAAHDVGLQQSMGIQAQIDQANEEMKALDTNTMAQTEGHLWNTKPTAAAVAETNKQNAILARIDQLNKQKGEIDATTKAGGSLWQAKRMATLNLGLFKAKASHDNYLDLANERRLILKAQGKSEAYDPILASILQAQQTFGNAVTKFSGGLEQQAAPAPLPRASHDLLVKSSGARLPVGAPVPGKPGLFQSGPEMPQKYDPVQEPGIGGDSPEAGTPSKFTMVGQSATSPATAPVKAAPAGAAAPPPVPGAVSPPAGSPAGKIDPALASEPFAQAARGVKNVGEVSMKDMAARYGSGQGPVQPNSLVKIKGRLDEINSTLENPKTLIDGRLRASLQKEQEYLTSLSTQRFARLTPEDQQRVTETTRDPTFWDKIKGAGKSLAEAAAEGGAGVMKGAALASNYMPDAAGGAGNVAASLAAPEMVKAQTEANPLYKAGSFIDEAAKETYAKNPHEDEGMVSQALNEAAKGAGGFAPLVASGPAAPLTIGLQTAGDQMESIYKDAIAKGAKPDVAAKIAVKRAMLSGGVQAALFALLPKPLQKATSKVIVDKITGGALTKFLTNRLAQGVEGAALGATSTAAANVAEGRPVGEGVAGAAVGLGAMQAIMPRAPHERAEPKRGEVAPSPEPAAPAPAEPAAPAEPFKPTGEGLPKSAEESAKTLVPEAEAIKAQTPPPAKSAEESAMAFKAHEELNRRAAAKEESAQKLVDQIQEATGKSRGEILATRAGKDIEAWHEELKKEAAYQKNPLVVDPERRSNELRADLKKLDVEWQDHVTQTGHEAEAAAEIERLKASQPAKTAAEAAAEADRQKKLGVELPEARTQARHDDLTARREAIEGELTAADRLRKSGEGADLLKKDLAGQAKEDPVADRKRWEAVQNELVEATRAGDEPRRAALFQENEEIKNRNSSDRGMPPEPIEAPKEEKPNAAQKSASSEATVREEGPPAEQPSDVPRAAAPAAPRKAKAAKATRAEPVREEVGQPEEAQAAPEPEPKAPAKEAKPEPVAEEAPEPPRRSMDDDTRKPPAQMSRAERVAELTEAGVKEVNGKPLEEANPAEIINAVGKLRRGQLGVTDEPKKLSDKLIAGLEKAKLRKPGMMMSDATGLVTAWDSALDLAILGVKAGRELAHMVELAVKRFRAAYPKATKADEVRLEKAIRDAHAAVHGAAEAPVSATPEAKAEQKAAEVISSPKVEKTQNKITKAWNDAREGANLRDTLAVTNEAAESQAKQTGHEAYTTVANELKRTLGKDDIAVAADALGMHVEAGKDGLKKLAEFKQKIEASTKIDPKWKARAIAAIDYASANYDKMQKAADLYRAFTDAQADREQAAGMPTLKRSDYVMHAQDLEDGTWLENFLGPGTGGMTATGSSSRKNRIFPTHADSLAAGINPKTINALDLLRSRVTAGENGVNLREWQNSLHNYVDPKTKQPIAMKALRVERPDGSSYYDAPKGYQIEMLGNQPLAIKKEYSGIVSALTDPSWWSKNETRKLEQKLNAAGKSINLLIDTFHLGRLAIQQSLIKTASISDFRAPVPSYKKGLNILDHSAEEMRTMAKHGEITPEQLTDLLEKKGKLNLLTGAGLNTGHIADAMHQEFIRSIPGIGDINKFIFEKFQRGAMAETALMEFDRQSKMYSDLKPHEVARQVARDINTRFGNLGKQGWFKSRSAQDAMRMIFLAPQWNEGLIKSEFGGVRQIGKAAIDAVTGKRMAMGMLGRQMIAGTLGIFAANQIVNQMTRGKFTWENPEEEWGAKLSAWIPDKVGGKSSGYFLNPLGVTAEISHQLLTRYERTGEPWTPFVEYLRGRASAITRPAWVMLTGKDGLGNPVRPGDRGKETVKAGIPAPIGASAVGSAVKGVFTGGNAEVFPGQFQKQAMQSFGVKTDTAPSPEQRVGHLAHEFNVAKKIQPSAEFYAGDYTDLTAALRRDNPNDIKKELDLLSAKKTPEQIAKHFKSWSSHPFTGKRDRETEFVRTLNSEQRAAYVKAQQARKQLGDRAQRAIDRMPPKLERTGTD